MRRGKGTTGKARGRCRRSKPNTQAGTTLVEVALASVLLTVGIGALSGAVVQAHDLGAVDHEERIALSAARQLAEEIQDATFNEIFALYNSDPNDDPDGVGTAPGDGFVVAQLNVREGDADGVVGRIAFPTRSLGGTAVALREDAEDLALGLPRDLSGDGEIDELDHADDYILLPVTILVEWTGVTGERESELHLLLASGS